MGPTRPWNILQLKSAKVAKLKPPVTQMRRRRTVSFFTRDWSNLAAKAGLSPSFEIEERLKPLSNAGISVMRVSVIHNYGNNRLAKIRMGAIPAHCSPP